MEPAIQHFGKAMTLVPSVLEEAAEELVGKSKRKWAVMVVAFVVGAIAAFFVIRFEKRRTEAVLDLNEDGIDDASASRAVDVVDDSAWSHRREQLRRSELALRERVGSVSSRMNVRRARSLDQ